MVILTIFDHYIWSKVVNFERLSLIDDRGLIRRQIASRFPFQDKKSDLTSNFILDRLDIVEKDQFGNFFGIRQTKFNAESFNIQYFA